MSGIEVIWDVYSAPYSESNHFSLEWRSMNWKTLYWLGLLKVSKNVSFQNGTVSQNRRNIV